jgi:EAL domain-containing protein (putative c-di-GMP-specific phosphodiesterase class I)
MKARVDAGIAPPILAINLSATEFKFAGIEHNIFDAIDRHGLPPELVEIEITESTIMDVSERSDDVLTRMRRRGIRISIDDFNTGYSSLAYINRFRPNRIKITQEFVAGMLENEADRAVVRAIVEMAQNLCISLIAEGVETAAQAKFLCELGCCEAQGFAYSPCLPANAMTEALRSRATFALADGRGLLLAG